MDQHAPCYCCYGVDSSLCNGVVVVCSWCCMIHCLLELLKVLSESFGGEGTAIVCHKLERNNSRIKAQLEEFIQGFESFMCVEKGLADHNDVTGCMINKDASSCVKVCVLGSPSQCKESSLG